MLSIVNRGWGSAIISYIDVSSSGLKQTKLRSSQRLHESTRLRVENIVSCSKRSALETDK